MAVRQIENTGNYQLTWDCPTSTIAVNVKVEWNFDKKVKPADQAKFRQRFQSVVPLKWNSHPYFLEAQRSYDMVKRADAIRRAPALYRDTLWDIPLDGHGMPPAVKFTFGITTTTSGEHWDIEVKDFSDRSNVNPTFGDVNVGLNDDDWVLQHEFGHALGLPDEYDECVDGARTWALCHLRNLPRATEYFKDRGGIMSVGPSLRGRYFRELRDHLNRWTHYRYMFQVRPVGSGDSLKEDAPTPPGGGRRPGHG